MLHNIIIMPNVLNIKCGDKLRIIGFKPDSARLYRTKLLAMGLTPGIEFRISRIAPLGDPIEIEIRGYMLSLRKNEVAVLKLEHVFTLHENT